MFIIPDHTDHLVSWRAGRPIRSHLRWMVIKRKKELWARTIMWMFVWSYLPLQTATSTGLNWLLSLKAWIKTCKGNGSLVMKLMLVLSKIDLSMRINIGRLACRWILTERRTVISGGLSIQTHLCRLTRWELRRCLTILMKRTRSRNKENCLKQHRYWPTARGMKAINSFSSMSIQRN